MSKVLVLCQRKTGRISEKNSENVSKQINPAIEELVSDIIREPCNFEYMTPGLELDGTADYPFALDKKEEAQTFIRENQKGYKAVVFQTCPIVLLENILFLVYSLLEDNGLLMFIAVTKKSIRKIDMIKSEESYISYEEFVTELYKYFEPTDQPFIFKKKSKKK